MTSSHEGVIDAFLSGTGPAWALLAFLLLVAATYIRFLEERCYPAWTWRLYYLLSLLIFSSRATPVYITHESLLMVLEIILLASTGLGAAALFYYIVNTPETPTLRDILQFIVYEWRARGRGPEARHDDD